MENCNIKITTSIIEGKKSGQIVLEGDLSIRNANEIKQKIIKSLNEYECLKVVVQNVKDIDLSVFMILYAHKKREKVKFLQLNPNNLVKDESYKTNLCKSGLIELFHVFNN
jgi:ABC-type transporter Mla MlaB component